MYISWTEGFITKFETESVYHAVRAGSLTVVWANISLRGFKAFWLADLNGTDSLVDLVDDGRILLWK